MSRLMVRLAISFLVVLIPLNSFGLSFPAVIFDEMLSKAGAVAEVSIIEGRLENSRSGTKFSYKLRIDTLYQGIPPLTLDEMDRGLQIGGRFLLVASRKEIGSSVLLLPIVMLGADAEHDGLWLGLHGRRFETSSQIRQMALGEECILHAPESSALLNPCTSGSRFLSWSDLDRYLRLQLQ